jgi:hypothetical protein
MIDRETAEQVQQEFERFNDKDFILLNKIVEVYKQRVQLQDEIDVLSEGVESEVSEGELKMIKTKSKENETVFQKEARERAMKKRYRDGLKRFFVKRLSHHYWEIFQALKSAT